MTTLFGSKYFAFILSAFGITAAVLVLMTLWILIVYRVRRRQLDQLEKAGLKRASRSDG